MHRNTVNGEGIEGTHPIWRDGSCFSGDGLVLEAINPIDLERDVFLGALSRALKEVPYLESGTSPS